MLSQEGVSEVKKIKNNKIVYIDDEGKKQKVDKDTYIKKMIAAKATEAAADAAASSKIAIDKVTSDISGILTKDGGYSQEQVETGVEKLFADKDGANLTEAELTMLGEVTDA
jgi:BRCT domain type II-containing protein